MRFILNFIFYGILFYLIYLIFPEAFATMVSWAERVTEFLKDLYLQLASRFQEWRRPDSTAPQQSALLFLTWWLYARLKRS